VLPPTLVQELMMPKSALALGHRFPVATRCDLLASADLQHPKPSQNQEMY